MNRLRRISLLMIALCVLLMAGAATAQEQGTDEQGNIVYFVRPNDTLFRLSLRYRTTVGAIARLNNIPNPNLIFIGERLLIPASGGSTPTPTGTRPPATATLPATATTFPATNAPTATRPAPTATLPVTLAPTGVPGACQTTYTVRYNDTLGSIARRYNTTARAIAQANNILNINLIYVGQQLCIPFGTGPAATVTPRPTATRPAATAVPGSTMTPTLGVTGAPTSLPTLPPTIPAPPGGFELGGQVFAFADTAAMQLAGMTWAKGQVRWRTGDDTSAARAFIDDARAKGFKPLISLVGDPAEVAADFNGYIQRYAAFAGEVAALSPEGIEVWNEANIDREWPAGLISPASYTQLLTATYAAIKRANPNVLVISGAPAPTGFFGGRCTGTGCDDDAFIRGMAAAGARNAADCIGVHYNEGVVPPDATSGDPRGNPNHYSRYFPTMVNLYATVFPNKPLCFTELGYVTPDGLGSPLPPGFEWGGNTSVQEQAEWLARAATLSRQSGRIRLLIVWNVDATRYDDDPQAGWAIVRGGQCLACLTLGAAMGS